MTNGGREGTRGMRGDAWGCDYAFLKKSLAKNLLEGFLLAQRWISK